MRHGCTVSGATSEAARETSGSLSPPTLGGAREGHLTIAGTMFTIAQRARKRTEALDFDGLGADAFLYSATSGDWTRYTWRVRFRRSKEGVSTAA